MSDLQLQAGSEPQGLLFPQSEGLETPSVWIRDCSGKNWNVDDDILNIIRGKDKTDKMPYLTHLYPPHLKMSFDCFSFYFFT